jgi:very-short-patch-repair endonuclease
MITLAMKNRVYKKPDKPAYMVSLARELRRNATPAEIKLWNALRSHNFSGVHFRRQVPYGRYIFDFYCFGKKVAIEIDGEIHNNQKQYDFYRDKTVSAAGITVLRFSNTEVMENIQNVLNQIEQTFITDTSFPLP